MAYDSGAFRVSLTRDGHPVPQREVTEAKKRTGVPAIQLVDRSASVNTSFVNVLDPLFAWFNEMDAQDILDENIDLLIEFDPSKHFPSGKKEKRRGYLCLIEESPFLVFDNFNAVQIPLGQSEHLEKLKLSSTFEKSLANNALHKAIYCIGSHDYVIHSEQDIFHYYTSIRQESGEAQALEMIRWWAQKGTIAPLGSADAKQPDMFFQRSPFSWYPQPAEMSGV